MQETRSDPYSDALKLLARRELSASQLRERLLVRDHTPRDTEAAITRLTESGALDDRRVARAYARTAASVKGRGRLRIIRELHAIGIARDMAAEAVAEVFDDVDEATLIDRALSKKLRHRRGIGSKQEHARLYNFLTRQGFTATGISQALRRLADDHD